MVKRFLSLSIRHKLIAILLLTNGVILALVSLAFVVNEVTGFRSEMQTELTALADIVGNNSSAAVAFNDRSAASETLSGLRAKPYILTAFVMLKDDSVLASYFAPGVEPQQLPFWEGGVNGNRIDGSGFRAALGGSRSSFAVSANI